MRHIRLKFCLLPKKIELQIWKRFCKKAPFNVFSKIIQKDVERDKLVSCVVGNSIKNG